MLELPVPIPEILEPALLATDTKIDDFIGEDENILNIAVFGGNMGPRKGLIPLCEELSKLDTNKFRLKIFGSYDHVIKDLCSSYSFEIDFLGFQEVDFLKPSEKNTLRVYPALSECMSVVQLQGLFSGDSIMIYRRGRIRFKIDGLENIVLDSFQRFQIILKIISTALSQYINPIL